MVNDKLFTVYCHRNLITGKYYVGITCKTLKDRWRDGKGYPKGAFHNAIQKYGWHNFEHIILETGLNHKEACEKEKFYIRILNSKIPNGYNLTDGGESNYGWTPSEETRRKISENQKGKHVGFHHTEETKRKISEGNKGKQKDLGRKWTEHQTKIMSERMKGNKYGAKIAKLYGKPVIQMTLEGEFMAEYPTLCLAERLTGVARCHIRMVIKGKMKQSGGYRWMLKEVQ